MSEDLIHLGEHCSIQSCNTLDFLPITCSHCSKVFCKSHFSPVVHKCANLEIVQDQQPVTYKPYEECHVCKVRDVTNVLCEPCQRLFCMSHRTLEQHDCPTLRSNETPPAVLDQRHSAINTVNTGVKGVNPKRKGAKSLAMERKVMLMKMKNVSEGPRSVPMEERLYVNVMTDVKPNCYYHFSITWPVGRCVDHVANHLKMRNNNDKVGSDTLTMSLRGTPLAMSDLLSSVCSSGDSVSLSYQSNV